MDLVSAGRFGQWHNFGALHRHLSNSFGKLGLVADDLIIVSLQDKSPHAPGLIRLFLSRAPEMELKEWVTTDAQGKDTRVEVSSIVKNETIDQAMFKIESPTFNKLKQ